MTDHKELELSQEITLTITGEDLQNFKRLDQFLNEKIKNYSRTFIKKMFLAGHIWAKNGDKLELKKMPAQGVEIIIEIPTPLECEMVAENIPLEILYEDEDMVIVNKPQGMVTHPAPGNYSGTLVNAILYHCPDLKGVGDQKRPGIVHRLDKDTSGVMVVAKNQQTHEHLVLLFSSHQITRKYQALTLGPTIAQGGTLQSLLARDPKNRLKMTSKIEQGKNSITHFKVLKKLKRLHHIELTLETGRTHQIRVHLSELLKHPLLMDPVYGTPKGDIAYLESLFDQKPQEQQLVAMLAQNTGQYLHAKVLGFTHPRSKKEILIEKRPPENFEQILNLMNQYA